ncbi:MAG: hypothetical protein IKE29_13655 [Paenibacillus sp.]|uniref:hypothetical protein n=1 Tax=Paenibacillus sp. TaxID=58172 RepID=UPI0025D4C48F|nr:hypothetical protein [Paenibacillus sp.]MBR2565652.1 hypothetical protein [Paenibacillus sp.]
MSEGVKVEFEISAWGQETTSGEGNCFQKHEMMKIRTLPKNTTLEQLEVLVKGMIREIKTTYPQPEQLAVKVTLRAKEIEGELTYLG